MKFSIVIPLYNKVNYVRATLASVFSQNRLPHELILVDDCSTDGSLETAKAFFAELPASLSVVGIRILELDRNHGPGHARNIGFAETTGEVVCFLDADDVFAPGLLEAAEELMERKRIDFLIIGILRFPSKVSSPRLTSIEGGLKRLANDAYELLSPLKAVTSPGFVMGTGSNVMVKRNG